MKTKAEIIEILKEFEADLYSSQGSRVNADVIRNYIAEYIMELIPTEAEFKKQLDSLPYTEHKDYGQYNDGVLMGFEMCWDWMQNKLNKSK